MSYKEQRKENPVEQLIQNVGGEAQVKTPNFLKKKEETAPVSGSAPAAAVNETMIEVVALITENYHIGKHAGKLVKGKRMPLPHDVALTLRENGAVELLDR